MTHVRIVHLTDLHLFADSDGKSLPFEEADTTIRTLCRLTELGYAPRFVADLIPGFNIHLPDALRALESTVERLLDVSPAPVVILQTGDVTAHGARIDAHTGGISFPTFEYWAARSKRWKERGARAVYNLFGNHDVWPGTLPLLRPLATRRIEPALRRVMGLGFDKLLPRVETFTERGSLNVQVALINSVNPGTLPNTLAIGSVLPDVMFAHEQERMYPQSNTQDPIQEIARAFTEAPADPTLPTLRIAALHHPPHFFGATSVFSYITEGALLNADALSRALERAGCHLVIAGHRHHVDPPVGAPNASPRAYDAAAAPQPPLPARLPQLVAATPTQRPEATGVAPSFNVYDVKLDAKKKSHSVERTVFRFRETTVSSHVQFFRPGNSERLLERFPL